MNDNFFATNMVATYMSLLGKRLRSILSWIKTGDFNSLSQAIKDQFWIKSTPVRRIFRKYFFAKRRRRQYIKNLLVEFFDYQIERSESQKEIALIVQDGTTHPKSSAFIRLISPLLDETLRKNYHFNLYDQDTTSLEPGTDICIVQRTAFSSEASANKLLKYLDTHSIPLIIDNDDAFHVIDSSHPEHSMQTGKIKALNMLVPS
ncbi:MAG: hypothetical protein M3Q36_03870, partial [bacterium]|nr:hypothetical protein [bacterium]